MYSIPERGDWQLHWLGMRSCTDEGRETDGQIHRRLSTAAVRILVSPFLHNLHSTYFQRSLGGEPRQELGEAREKPATPRE